MLKADDLHAWVDWEGIPPTADWMSEVFSAIESALSSVFVVSAGSLQSQICLQELEHATTCRKRLIPLVWGDMDVGRVPDTLRRLNWITCRGDTDVAAASASLIEALDTDLEWVREHTRLLVRAVGWARYATREDSLLLRGADLAHAERWLK